MAVRRLATKPYPDQRPGTSGLRKKVAIVRQPNYLENYFQALFDTLPQWRGATLVVGGDGRYYSDLALQTLFRLAAGNGIARLLVGRDGLLATPAVSHLIRARRAAGGVLLTASHNPGGPQADFGIKIDLDNGGPAPESVTEAVYRRSRELECFFREDSDAPPALDRLGEQRCGALTIEVIDPIADYAALLESLFDFDRIAGLLGSGRLRLVFDAMHALTGRYAEEILVRRLGAPPASVVRGRLLADFGGGNPDPDPRYATHLLGLMRSADAPDLGAASDGDGDRYLIAGRGFSVSPGDGLAVLAANAKLVPGYRSGLVGVARTLPTSRAVDRVAAALDIPCYETPVGWKFFGRLLDAGRITLCGEEAYAASSNHIRDKDGLWALLFWLNVLAARDASPRRLLADHWRRFGRDYYLRLDYHSDDGERARRLLDALRARLPRLGGRCFGEFGELTQADEFHYCDPVDASRSERQGIRLVFAQRARVVLRLSGTSTEAAVLRVYLERHCRGGGFDPSPQQALRRLARLTAVLTELRRWLGSVAPSVSV